MELILAKESVVQIVWGYGPPYQEGQLVWRPSIEEVCVIDDFINYNNTLSLRPKIEDNDWELQLSIDVFRKLEIKIGNWIYARETEFGGLVEDIERINDVVKVSGANFRGYLARHMISPPIAKANSFGDYVHRIMESNALLWNIWEFDHSSGSVGSMYSDPYVLGMKRSTDVVIDDKWRYASYLSAMTKSLRNNGLRLETKHVYVDYSDESTSEFRFPTYYKGEQAYTFAISSQPIVDYSDEDLFSQDYDLRISSGHLTKNKRKFLWCLGKGNLEDREVVVLVDGYPQTIGAPDTVGSLWNSEIFDYPNAESREELIKAGQERYFDSFVEEKYIELFVDNIKIEFFLGDIIGGEDFVTGINTKAEIISKELTISNGNEEIRYKIGGK